MTIRSALDVYVLRMQFMLTNSCRGRLVRIRHLVPEHLFDRRQVRRQREQDHGVRLQLQLVHSDQREHQDCRGIRVCPHIPFFPYLSLPLSRSTYSTVFSTFF